MKQFLLACLVAIFFSSCKDEKKTVALENTVSKNQKEITTLIRNVLTWSDSKNGVNVLPVLISENDTVYRGFDMIQLSKNIIVLEQTGFFTAEFRNNYTNIIKTLDKRIRDKTFEIWHVGDLPTFSFGNDVNPWCNCQDICSEINDVEVEVIRLDEMKGEFYWKFGGMKPENDSSCKEFRYKFKVAKQNGTWKIDWMEGFDYETSIKKDGL